MSYKLVVTVPLTHADLVRQAIGEAGGGRVGKYSFCSFSSRGIGRSKPDADAHPHIGTVGKIEEIEEERIEITVDEDSLKSVVAAIKKVHPYEEIALDVYTLQQF